MNPNVLASASFPETLLIHSFFVPGNRVLHFKRELSICTDARLISRPAKKSENISAFTTLLTCVVFCGNAPPRYFSLSRIGLLPDYDVWKRTKELHLNSLS